MYSRGIRLILVLIAVSAVGLLTASNASAFCGFYVADGNEKLTNNATMVVMMRDGTRTVLSMQNAYEGPPSDFAMVVPVPVVLEKDNVKTLSQATFDKVDKMAAPRLVEYWERDPCWKPPTRPWYEGIMPTKSDQVYESAGAPPPNEAFVEVKATFEVGEYDVVILDSNDAGALDAWLRERKYNVPQGAEAALRPYIANGMYFFVAKVNAKKVKFEGNRAKLSPLRFHYDTKEFTLPVRLGMLNANGPQDLIVHILARNQRYEVANFKNVTIPTNLDVTNDVRKAYASFYAALFDKTLAKNPGAVVTEYAWDASTCDPCPGPNLNGSDFQVLGADVLDGKPNRGFVLTRLHARYTKDNLGEDLVFKAAPPIVGGREVYVDTHELEESSKPAGTNNFQGRYAIRHVWEGEIACDDPVRGRWGGPPAGKTSHKPTAATDTASASRDAIKVETVTRRDVPELGIKASTTTKALLVTPKSSSSGGCSTAGRSTKQPLSALLLLLGILAFRKRT